MDPVVAGISVGPADAHMLAVMLCVFGSVAVLAFLGVWLFERPFLARVFGIYRSGDWS